MMEFDLKSEGRIRLWQDDLPQIQSSVIRTVERRVRTEAQSKGLDQCVAVEFFQHLGGLCAYGLLGATFLSHRDPSLIIRLAVSRQDDVRLAGTLAENVDVVHAGLPDEYVESVIMGSVKEDGVSALGNGVLYYVCAAHGEVSSSERVFSYLARAVISLLGQTGSEVERGPIPAFFTANGLFDNDV